MADGSVAACRRAYPCAWHPQLPLTLQSNDPHTTVTSESMAWHQTCPKAEAPKNWSRLTRDKLAAMFKSSAADVCHLTTTRTPFPPNVSWTWFAHTSR